MAADIAETILALRPVRPYWGPRKLRAVLARDHLETGWPAASTTGDLLREHGLSQPFRTVAAANEVWCIDFKGWFRTRDGHRCDPLTVSDAHSRYLLVCQIIPPRTEPVRTVVEAAFRRYGMPRALRSDNGAPFAGVGAAGLSRLSVGWAKAGIALERIAPGQPQQNGRHERMHRTLKAETTKPPAASIAEQQARFDAFRHDFNVNRPHEALDQQPPASVYQPSTQSYPEALVEPWYDAEHAVRRVRHNGEIKWGGNLVFVSEALKGEPVGIAETDHGDSIVRFADIDLGVIDRTTNKLHRFSAARPGAEAVHNQKTVTHVTGQ